jgi:hypothetical protein
MEQNNKTLLGTAPDIDPQDPRQLDNAQYDPRTFLQSHLSGACAKADQNKQCVRLETTRGSIYLLPETHLVLSQINDSQLRTLTTVSPCHAYCSPVDESTPFAAGYGEDAGHPAE